MVTMIKEIEYPVYATGGGAAVGRISWSSVFAGTAVGLGCLAALSLLGAGMGFGGVPTQRLGSAVYATIGFGGLAWTLLAGAIAAYCGGWVSGRLAGAGRISDSVIHGLACWGTAVVIAGVFSVRLAYQNLGAVEFARAVGDAGFFGFVLLAVSAACSALGARAGTRVFKPVAMTEPRRYPVEV